MGTASHDYLSQVIVNIALGNSDVYKYTLQEAFNYMLGETDLHKYSIQQALKELTGLDGDPQAILNQLIGNTDPYKYDVQACLNYLEGNIIVDYSDLQQFLSKMTDEEIGDNVGSLPAKTVYACPEILNDNPTIALDSDPSSTITSVNGSSTTTGVSISGDTISFDFSEMPETRVWQIGLSNGTNLILLGSTRIFDTSSNGNHGTLSGTVTVDYDWSEQSVFNPYATRGFNKYFRNLTGSQITLTFDGTDYDVAANGVLIVPDALLEVKGSLDDMTGDTSDAEIISVPEVGSTGLDVYDADITYTQDNNTILDAEDCLIDFDPDAGTNAILDIYDRDNTTFRDTDVSQLGSYDSSYPYRWAVSELYDNEETASTIRAGKLRMFMQTVYNGNIPIGVKRIVNYDDQRLILGSELLDSWSAVDTSVSEVEFEGETVTKITATNSATCYIYKSLSDSIKTVYGDIEIYIPSSNTSLGQVQVGSNSLPDDQFGSTTITDTWVRISNIVNISHNNHFDILVYLLTSGGGTTITIGDYIYIRNTTFKQTFSDTTTLSRLANTLNTPAIEDQGTAYDSKLYLDSSIRTSSINQDDEIANVGFRGDDVTVTDIDGNGTTATATAATHGYSTGDRIEISGSTSYDGVYIITVTDANTFTFASSEVTTDESGTANKLGDTVKSIIDLSGNTTVTQANETKQPILTSDSSLLYNNNKYVVGLLTDIDFNQPFTVFMWIYGVPSLGDASSLFCLGRSSKRDGLTTYGSSSKSEYMCINLYASETFYSEEKVFTPDTWALFTWESDASTITTTNWISSFKFFKNGNEIIIDVGTGSAVAPTISTSTVQINGYGVGGFCDNLKHGVFAIFQKCFSDEDVLAFYNKTKSKYGL